MADNADLVSVSTDEDFPNLNVYLRRGIGAVILFRHLENERIWARTVQFLISLGFLALGFACAWAALKIKMHYDFDVLYGIPLLLVMLACIFGLPFALCMIFKVTMQPPYIVRREIHLDPMRDQVRVYRGKKMETARPLRLFHTTSVEPHPKAEIERQKLRGKVGNYQRQFVLFGWFGIGGGEKVELLSRWEYPYQNSLVEVQKAIEYGKLLADKMQQAAQGEGAVAAPEGFKGRILPADGGGGMKPPLD